MTEFDWNQLVHDTVPECPPLPCDDEPIDWNALHCDPDIIRQPGLHPVRWLLAECVSGHGVRFGTNL